MNTLDTLVTDATSSPNRSSRDAVLDQPTRDRLDAFVEHLESIGRTTATARSYRSYLVTYLTNDLSFDEQTSDVKSAARAFARFTQQ
jgi:hypothetical protein